MRRAWRTTGTAVLLAAWVICGGTAQAAPDGNGLLRLAHLSPDTPAVDVYVDAVADPEAGITLEGVDYGTVSDYQDVPPAPVSTRPTGTTPALAASSTGSTVSPPSGSSSTSTL